MQRRTILLMLVGAVVLLYTAQHVGILLYERYETDWLFTPSHYLGGVCVALALLYISAGFRLRISVFLCLALVFSIGLAWEAWEYLMGFGVTYADTLSDLIADVLGGYTAYLVAQNHND